MSRFLPFCVPALAALLAGCSTPAAPPVLAPPARPPSASAAVDDPPGSVACSTISAAVRAGTLMQPGVIADVGRSTATADAPVADAAVRLQQAYDRAVAARGRDDEPDRVAEVSAAAAEMVSVCADSGLETAG
ncbi:hypothetical protein COUCH_32830 [Couchioplanes caeruleus]|uniref:hypothetical protein n=1 Tax=Couchioplanes caeruleus TaxID=56438 RepID=UPI0020BFA66C|nr:hypothetical protein [Couchioplanes caeruleus]UQU63728.1 hypothetical protein COUCH_32830 [Couchioplanes caeruleus]